MIAVVCGSDSKDYMGGRVQKVRTALGRVCVQGEGSKFKSKSRDQNRRLRHHDRRQRITRLAKPGGGSMELTPSGRVAP